MDTPPKRSPVGVSVEDALHNEVKARAASLGLKLQDAYEHALRQWLGQERGKCPLDELSRPDRALAESLIDVIRGGDKEFYEALRLQVKLWLRMRGQ